MRIVVVLDHDPEAKRCEAESFSQHFVGGVCAEGANPILALGALVEKWLVLERQQEVLNEIGDS